MVGEIQDSMMSRHDSRHLCGGGSTGQLLLTSQETETGLGTESSRLVPSDSLPPWRSHIPKGSTGFQNSASNTVQVQEALKDISH